MWADSPGCLYRVITNLHTRQTLCLYRLSLSQLTNYGRLSSEIITNPTRAATRGEASRYQFACVGQIEEK